MGEFRFVEVAGGKSILNLKDLSRGGVPAFASDGRTLAVVHPGHICLWETATGKLRKRLDGRGLHAPSALRFAPDGRSLAVAEADHSILVWNLTGPQWRRSLKDEELESLWRDLAGEDAERAYRAVWGLATVPQGVPLLRRRLLPLPTVEPKRLAQLLADLGDKRFAVRAKATEELERLGDLVEPALRKALADDPPLETLRRLETLLSKVVRGTERFRRLRAVEALEHAATQESRQLLQLLADATAETLLAEQARAALERLKRRAIP
jgi:hypothetical protein